MALVEIPRKRWNPKEVDFLQDNFEKLSRKEIAHLLNRTVSSIEHKAFNLGLLLKRQPGRTSKQAIQLKHRFGITLDDYDRMFEQQRGLCAVCGKPESFVHPSGVVCRLAVDHNHITGKIRGLLCRGCNLGLGSFKDNKGFLFNAIRYLEACE